MQASLILALGAQNIFVLQAGLRKDKHLLVALVSSLCDTFLIFVGVLGVATFFVQFPVLKIGLGFVGVGFLLFYGILKLREAQKFSPVRPSEYRSTTFKQTILASLGFSLLNPHVYLDTIVLIGGYASKFEGLTERSVFGLGASAFSTIWFFGLVLSASVASRFLNSPKAMRWVSLISGLVLVVLAAKLGSDVLGWVRD